MLVLSQSDGFGVNSFAGSPRFKDSHEILHADTAVTTDVLGTGGAGRIAVVTVIFAVEVDVAITDVVATHADDDGLRIECWDIQPGHANAAVLKESSCMVFCG